jgi:hypothetical protein
MSFLADFAEIRTTVTVTYTEMATARDVPGVTALRYPTGFTGRNDPGPSRLNDAADTTFVIDAAPLAAVIPEKNDKIVQGSETFFVERADKYEYAAGPFWEFACRRLP